MTSDRGIAIIGMACLFPGAPNLDAYWRNILNKVDAITEPPPEAWDTDVYYDPSFSDTDKVYCKQGGYLGSLVSFDPLPHGVPPFAVGGEPDQWLALQLAHDAMADAGCLNLPEEIRRRTAVIFGKGTYLNEGNMMVVERGLIVGQTLEIIKRLHPEHTDDQLERLREEMKRALPPVGPETVPGLIPNIIAGRIANRLDLMGPTYTVDAACASSLVAVQQAMRDLNHGECDLALVGGAQVWMSVPTLNVFCQLGALSRRQQIRPFDKDADGTLLGEGIGTVVLKRQADAERDGDRIYAVIKGVGVASDGRGASVMAPRVEGEELAVRRAYESAGIAPRTVGLIEAHGTATPVGDVVEVQSLARVFGQREGELASCALGTVKSMISHTIPAAGVAGLIKTALALYHKVLPPTLNCDEPNPKLELEKTPFYINTETRPWIHGGLTPRRAGVNAFGFGGINAHAILEEHSASGSDGPWNEQDGVRDIESPELSHLPSPWESEVCILSGATRADLLEQVARLDRFLETAVHAGEPVSLTDLAYTLNSSLSREESDCRLALIATSLEDLRRKLARAAQRLADPTSRRIKDVSGIYFAAEPLGRQGKLAFLFPGDGSQYPNMLADLCLHFPEVRECFDRSDRAFSGSSRGYVLSDIVFPRPAFSDEQRQWAVQRLARMDGAIEATMTGNAAMLALLRRLGLRPDVCAGHSAGEYSAMIAAGILDLDTEDRSAGFSRALNDYFRDAGSNDGVPRAVLLAIGADRDRVAAIAREAGGEIYLAMDNCAHQAILVGTEAAAERAVEILRREGLIYERLALDRAYHTRLFAPYTDNLHQVLDQVPIRAPRVPAYSCATAAPYPGDPEAIRSLIVEQLARPVEFRRMIEALHDDGVRLFVEAGPRGSLSAFVEDILRGRPFCAVPANVQHRSGITQLNHLVGMLAAHGVDLDFSYLYARRHANQVAWHGDGAEATPKRPNTKIDLHTPWPMLRLPEDVRSRLHLPQPPPPPPPPILGEGGGYERSNPLAQTLSEGYEVDSYSPLPILGEAPSGPGVGVTADVAATSTVMESYLATMEQFLAAQEQVMQAFLMGGDAMAPAPDSPPPQPLSQTLAEGKLLISDLPLSQFWERGSGGEGGPTPYPLLGDVIEWTKGELLITQRTFDLAEDRYLHDHTLGREISTTDPELLALTMMPLTMSLEILAEAASALAPDRVVVGLRDVHAYRWLIWDDQPQTLQVTARRAQGTTTEDHVVVEIRNLTEDGERDHPLKSPVVEATVILADSYPLPPVSRSLHLSDGRPSHWPAERLYTNVMFHGPRWQGMTAIELTGERGITAKLHVLPFDRFFRNNREPRFVLDPVVLDAAGQVIGCWAMEHLAAGKVCFPFGMEALDLYESRYPAGTTLDCAASIQHLGDQVIRSNIDVIAPGGRLWMRLTGWENRRFDVPEPFSPLIGASRDAAVSTEWPAPIARFPYGHLFQCRRLSLPHAPGQDFLKRAWAQRILSRAERVEFRRLRTPEPRQLEWLAARAAAKEALQQLLQARYGIDLRPADIEITHDPQGRPLVGGTWRGTVDAIPVVSLSHTQGHAVALAGLVEREGLPGIGIDIEQLRPRPAGFDEIAFDAGERELIAMLPVEQRAEWLVRGWCAKEAVAKALGTGLIEGPRSISIEAIDAGREQVAVRLTGELAARFPDLAEAYVIAYTGCHDDLIFATTNCDTIRTWSPALADQAR